MTDSEQAHQKIRAFGYHAEESWKGTKTDSKVVLQAEAEGPSESPSDNTVVMVSKTHTTKATTSRAKPE